MLLIYTLQSPIQVSFSANDFAKFEFHFLVNSYPNSNANFDL